MNNRVLTIVLGLALGVVLGACAAGEASPEPIHEELTAKSVTIEYVAHACFRITSPNGDRVLLDPFASRVWLGYDFPPGVDADAIFISHPHYDHDGGVFIGRSPPWATGSRVLREPGLYKVGEIKVQGVAGKHADPWGKEFGQRNTIWVLDVAGLRIVHLGDNGPVSKQAREELGRIDILLVPVDDQYHILKKAEITRALKELAPRVVIPMHYRHPDLESDESSPQDLGGIDGWLKKRKRVRRLGSHSAQFSPERLPDKQEIFVFEHWPDMQAP